MCQAARCVTETFSTTCAVHVKQCEGWQLYGFCGSVADHWRLKPEVSWVRFSTTTGLFTFLYFLLITSEFINFQHEARCCGHILLLKLLLVSGPAKNMSPACKDACVQMMNRFCNWSTYRGHTTFSKQDKESYFC